MNPVTIPTKITLDVIFFLVDFEFCLGNYIPVAKIRYLLFEISHPHLQKYEEKLKINGTFQDLMNELVPAEKKEGEKPVQKKEK